MNISGKKYELKRAKTHKGRMHIKKQLPKVEEDPKECLFINTTNSSELIRLAVSEFYQMRKSFSKKLLKKNNIENPFSNAESIEYFCKKNQGSLFFTSSDTKKRPMNLIFGNTHDSKLLDMFEFEVSNFIPCEYFKENTVFIDNTTQPILVFLGEQFETDHAFDRLRKYFMDFFKQDQLKEVNVSDLTRIITFSIDENKLVKIRQYQVEFVSEYKLTPGEMLLNEIGPSFDLASRRQLLASDTDYRQACRQPRLVNKQKIKNKEFSMMGTKAKLYLPKQNLNAISLKKYKKALGNKRERSNGDDETGNKDGNKEVREVKDIDDYKSNTQKRKEKKKGSFSKDKYSSSENKEIKNGNKKRNDLDFDVARDDVKAKNRGHKKNNNNNKKPSLKKKNNLLSTGN